MQLYLLGDQALLAYCNDEHAALSLASRARGGQFPWLLDVVQAYKSVAFFLEVEQVSMDEAGARLQELSSASPDDTVSLPGQLHVIPCCYAMGPDLERVAQFTKLSTKEVIRLHAGQTYTVYAIGFCPGFPYLGYLPEALSGVPRLESPRLRVEAGSIGLTGRQTGIYTEARPGGWNIIGRTPLELVNVANEYFPLRTGDRIQFRPIDDKEFRQLESQRMKVER